MSSQAAKKLQPLKEKLSIIIPAYNEEGTILFILNKILRQSLDRDYEIIIIDDGSKDRTAERVKEFIKVHPEVKIFYYRQNNQGKGGAVKTGISKASGNILLIQDADLEYDPKDYMPILDRIDQGAKVVYGSRNLGNKKHPHSSMMFYWGGILVTSVTNFLYGSKLTDEATCYKVFHRDIFQLVDFYRKDFSWEPEITAKILKQKIEIIEVPISYSPRSKKEGKKISWLDGVKAIWVLIYEFCRKS